MFSYPMVRKFLKLLISSDAPTLEMGRCCKNPHRYHYTVRYSISRNDFMDVLGFFIGARINTKDSKWLTPLHRACASGNAVSIIVEFHNLFCTMIASIVCKICRNLDKTHVRDFKLFLLSSIHTDLLYLHRLLLDNRIYSIYLRLTHCSTCKQEDT